MHRLIVLLTLSIGALLAQPVVNNLTVLPTHGSAMFRLQLSDSSGVNLWIRYGTSPQSLENSATRWIATTSTVQTLAGGLKPRTRYYFQVVTQAGAQITNHACTSGGAGWDCDTPSGFGYFSTLDVPPNHGRPLEITPVNTSRPAIDGSTFTVNVAQDQSCTNLQAQLNACAAASPALNHEVIIPAGATCTGMHVLPPKPGPGVCVVRTSAESELPPQGFRISPAFESAMATLLFPISQSGQYDWRGSITNQGNNSNGWRFVGIKFSTEEPTNTSVVQIASVSDSGIVTTTTPHNLQTHQQLYISGVQGFDGRGPNGVYRISYNGPDTLTLQNAPALSCSSPPCHVPGTGTLVRTVASAVTSATNASPIVVTTATPHGFADMYRNPIVSISGSTITLAAGHRIPDSGDAAIEIEGSSVPAYNGVWEVASAGATTVAIENGPPSSCSSNCGTIKVSQTVHIVGIEGNSAANGTHRFTVTGPNTIQLDQTAGNGNYTGGGVLALDPDLYLGLVSIDKNASNVIFDRTIFDGRGFPNRITFGLVLHGVSSGIVDSYLSNIDSWRMVHPVTRQIQDGIATRYLATASAIDGTDGSNKVLRNNYINATGISVFVQDSTSSPTPDNIEVTRNTFSTSFVNMVGSPVSNGLYYPRRHLLEFKRGTRVLVDGNIFEGGWADFNPCGPSIGIAPRSGGVISDITITNNVLRNMSSGIQVVGVDDAPNSLTPLVQRVVIKNNLFYALNHWLYRSNPSSVGPGLCGYVVSLPLGIEDISIVHNTAFSMRGPNPQFLNYSGVKGEGALVRNNIFSHSQDFYGALMPATALGLVGTVKQGFEGWFSNSEFSNNIVIPEVRNSSSDSNWSSSSASVTFSKSACESYYAGFPGVRCVGNGSANESANDRINAVGFLDTKTFKLRLSGMSPWISASALSDNGRDMGVDHGLLESRTGAVQNVRTLSETAGAVELGYIAPDETACYVDLSSNVSLTPLRRIQDAGGMRNRRVTIDQLQPRSLYYYRVLCASDQPRGFFTTPE